MPNYLDETGLAELWGRVKEEDLKTAAKTTMTCGGETGNYKILLRPSTVVEQGPYFTDPSNVVCDSTSENYTIYTTIANDTCTYHAGRYSYGYYDRKYAYKIDHVTKTAQLLCDLSSYVSDIYPDRILAVDDTYIYVAKHLACPIGNSYSSTYMGYDECYGTIYKFNHNGILVTSRDSAKTSAESWSVELNSGFSGSSAYASIFYDSNTIYKQTKNYIVWRISSRSSSTNGDKHLFVFAISKNGLNVFKPRNYDSGFETQGFETMYEKDVLYMAYSSTAGKNQAKYYVYQLGDTVTILGDPSTSSFNAIVNNLGGSYYLYKITELYDHTSGVRYYYLILSDSSTLNSGYSTYYTVVTDNDFSPTTGKLTIKYVTTSIIPFGTDYYDPVTKEWVNHGYPYAIYPAYVPAEKTPVLNADFTLTPFPRVNGYYYFTRKADGLVYKVKDETVYNVDRVMEVV